MSPFVYSSPLCLCVHARARVCVCNVQLVSHYSIGSGCSVHRLWDVRKLSTSSSGSMDASVFQVGHTAGLLREYGKHVCCDYSIACLFFNNDNNIITGTCVDCSFGVG